MVIENKSLGVSAFHLITIKEPIGCFLFIKGGNVPEELMSFSISSWDTDKVPLKQLKQMVRYTHSGMGVPETRRNGPLLLPSWA